MRRNRFTLIHKVITLIAFLFFIYGCAIVGAKDPINRAEQDQKVLPKGVVITRTDNPTAFPSFEGFNLTRKYAGGENTHILIYSDNQNTIRLKIISNLDKTSADEIIHTSTFALRSLYGDTVSAYPGMISNKIVCDSKFIPKQTSCVYNGITVTYFIAYLSERLSYGACTDDLTPNKGVIAWTYCGNKKELRKFEFISAKQSFRDSSIEFMKENICR